MGASGPEEQKMRITDLSNRMPPKFLMRFLTAQNPLPNSSAEYAENGSSGGGMTDGGRDAAAHLAAVPAHGGARAPPACPEAAGPFFVSFRRRQSTQTT
jgi:hypothetical protein